MRPHEIYETLFSMEARLRALTCSSVPIGFEKAKLEKVVKHLLREEMQRRNKWLMFKDLQWDTDKVQRVLTRLEPRYSQHSIFHLRGMGELEHQLTRFPSAAHDDLPDALQGVVQLLQYPKHIKKTVNKSDPFEWWRNTAVKNRRPDKKPFVFGQRRNRFEIPAIKSYR